MTPFTTRLYDAWKAAAVENKILTQFEAAEDDRSGRWQQGDRILYGIRWQADGPEYYARNMTQGTAIVSAVVEKAVGPYSCQLNGYRALRPGGSGRPMGRQPDISPAIKDCRFHCQNADHPLSLLQREPLLQVSLPHFCWNAYYNAAPLEKAGHFLWIPVGNSQQSNDLPHWPQRLSAAFLADALALYRQLSHTTLFFNSLHAGASVNHIHFQSVYQSQPLPIESAIATDYRGIPVLQDYAVSAMAYPLTAAVADIFGCINRLQTQNIPFNLAFAGDRVIIVLRDADHAIVAEFPGDGLAALGMCGALKTVDPTAYETVTAETIDRAFGKMVIPAERIVDAWVSDHNLPA